MTEDLRRARTAAAFLMAHCPNPDCPIGCPDEHADIGLPEVACGTFRPEMQLGEEGGKGGRGDCGDGGELPSASEGQGDQSATRVPARDPILDLLIGAEKLLRIADRAAKKLDYMYQCGEASPRARTRRVDQRPACNPRTHTEPSGYSHPLRSEISRIAEFCCEMTLNGNAVSTGFRMPARGIPDFEERAA